MNAGRSSTIDVTDANIDLSESELEFIELQGELLKFEEDLFNLIGIEKPKIVNYELSLKYTRLNLSEDQVLGSTIFSRTQRLNQSKWEFFLRKLK